MQNTLIEMWKKYNLLVEFKLGMNKKGYSTRDLYSIQVQIVLLTEMIQIESMNVLGNLLLKKSYLRLLRCIDRGIEYLPDIVDNPEGWCLNKIENDIESWINEDTLIFTCKNNTNVFSKLSRNDNGRKYQDGKWQ